MTPEERRETFARFIEAVEDGDTRNQACAKAQVSWGTVSYWLNDPKFTTEGGEPMSARYARARTMSADAYADRRQEVVELATPETWQVAKMQGDVYAWRAAMADRGKYGDKTEVKVSGGIEHLHLDALRSISAKARIANDLPTVTSPKLLGVNISDAQPIDTVEHLDTE